MALTLTWISTDNITAGILAVKYRKGNRYPITVMFAEQCKVARIPCTSTKASEGHYPSSLYVLIIFTVVFILLNQFPEMREKL